MKKGVSMKKKMAALPAGDKAILKKDAKDNKKLSKVGLAMDIEHDKAALKRKK